MSLYDKERIHIRSQFPEETSDGRYGAILLYFLRNRERGDYQALTDARNRLPYDLTLTDDGVCRA